MCKGTKEVLIDDYLNVGHDQVVFVFQDQNDINEEDFYISDYRCCFYDTRSDAEQSTLMNNSKIDIENSNGIQFDPSVSTCDGYKTALSSLSNKILSVTCQLHDEESRILEKEEIINHSRTNLLSQSLNMDTLFNCFHGLVPLLGASNEESASDQQTLIDPIPVRVHNTWHKIYQHQIIVGVEIENTCKDNLHHLSLQLLSPGADFFSSTSKICFLSKRASKDNNSSKIQKLEEQDDPATTMYPSRRCHLIAMTKYTSLCSIDLEMIVGFVKDDGQRYSAFIGQRIIPARDLLSDEFSVPDLFSERDVKSGMAFDFANHKESFTLSSKTPNFHIPKLVSDRLNCSCNVFGKTTVLTPKHLSSEIRFLEHGSSYDCIVYAKSSQLLSMVVDELKNVLPADVVCKKSSDCLDKLLKGFRLLLQEEISSGIKYFDNQLQQIEEEQEKNQQVIILDSPKRKRSSKSESELLRSEFYSARASTDEHLLSSELF